MMAILRGLLYLPQWLLMDVIGMGWYRTTQVRGRIHDVVGPYFNRMDALNMGPYVPKSHVVVDFCFWGPRGARRLREMRVG